MGFSIIDGCLRRGGAATLNHPARYPVVEGAVIAPARYASRAGRTSEFVFETRWIDGEFRRTVLIDSKGSQSNRAEEGLLTARREGGPAELIPTIAVSYPSATYLDWELPHRAFDAHVRGSFQGGEPIVKAEWYRNLRNATFADLSPVFTTSPISLAYGSWDSSRAKGQLRLRGLFVSELFGQVVDPWSGDRSRNGDGTSRRSGGRLDPLGQQVHLAAHEFESLLALQRDEMSEKTVRGLAGEARRVRRGELISASSLGFGGVPPGVETPFGVAVPEVLRARTFSLAGLRRLRFGGTAEEDVAARRALLAMLLLGAAYADADPEIRAYCDVGAPAGTVRLDDEPIDLDLSIEACTAYLEEAIAALPARLAWTGQRQQLDGNPVIDRAATDDEADAGRDA